MKITKTRLKEIIKEELESTISEACGPVHAEPAMVHSPFQDRNVKVWELLTHMGLTPEQIEQVKDVLELNKAEAEVEDSFGIRLEGETKGDEEVLESIFNLAQNTGKMTTAIKNPQAQAALSNLIAEMLNTTQEYM